ncbi:MAG TPA: hypothetical protein EYN71_08880 [Flavobacteriales bacterium]|nr:hypothetical protein [Flavobacteriales bacterium]
MKNRIFSAATVLILYTSIALAQQGVLISDGAGSPDPTAILDIQSTTKGVLLPRMTTSAMLDINGAATGLMIYNTDDNSVYINRGTQSTSDWVNTAPDMAVAFLVYPDPGQTIPPSTQTVVEFALAAFNDGGYFDFSSSKYNVPYDGLYQFSTGVTIFNLDPTIEWVVEIWVDDGIPRAMVSNTNHTADVMQLTGSVSVILKLTAGTEVFVVVTQKGQQSPYPLSPDPITTWFSGHRLYY